MYSNLSQIDFKIWKKVNPDMKFDLDGSESYSEELRKTIRHLYERSTLTHSRKMTFPEFQDFLNNRLPEQIKGSYKNDQPSAMGWKLCSRGKIRDKQKIVKRMVSAGCRSHVDSINVSIGYLPERSEYFMVVKWKWKGEWSLMGQEGRKFEAEVIGPVPSQKEFKQMLSGINWK